MKRLMFLLAALGLLSLLVVGFATNGRAANASARTDEHDEASTEPQLVENSTTPFGKFRGIAYVKHVGRLVGTTSRGPYRVPYEIVAPAIPERGNGSVLVEPSHFALRLAARDILLGHDFLFNRGFSHAGIGWSTFELSILDPTATDAFIVGGAGGDDDGIVVDFARALRESPEARALLGELDAVYAAGYSQTSFTVNRVIHLPDGDDLFELTFLAGIIWPHPGSEAISEPRLAPGRVIVLNTESEVLFGLTERFRPEDDRFPNYRQYEIAGAPHVPLPLDEVSIMPPQDWTPVARALFAAGDAWVQDGIEPPPSVALESTSEPDPVYPFATGIARDENLNARGGVRLPALQIGRGQFVASRFDEPFPLLLFGRFVDLQCVPLADGSPRFATHGEYVSAFADATNNAVRQRFLLWKDAVALLEEAAESEVGKPGSCP